MKFIKVMPYDDGTEYHFCGIYKIVKYRKGQYNAYFIQEHQRNWGDHVCKPPHFDARGNRCWNSLESAVADCEKHAKQYTPSNEIKRRAAEIVDSYAETA